MRGIKIFNIAQSRWNEFAKQFGVTVNEDLFIDLITGGITNTIMLAEIIYEMIKENVNQKLVKKIHFIELPQNKQKSVFEIRLATSFHSLIELSYKYWRKNKKLPDWNLVISALPNVKTFKSDVMLQALQKVFILVFNEPELKTFCDTFIPFGKGFFE